jgi:transcriptional regulator with XRE-family HTH domain
MEVVAIGKNIKKLRNERGLTQKQLGEIVGYSYRTIRRVETEPDYPLTLNNLNKILAPLGYVANLEVKTLFLEPM